MNPRTAAVLFVIAAALGAFVYFYEIRGAEQRKEAEQVAKQLFSGVKAEQVHEIVLETTDGKSARLIRQEGHWVLVEPLAFPADETKSDGLASSLAQLSSEKVIEAAQAPEVYGLGDGARRIYFKTQDAAYEVWIGDKTPVGASSYAKTGDSDAIYTIESYKATSLTASLDDLREKRPLRFDHGSVQEIVVSWPEGRVRLREHAGEWVLAEPIDDRGDSHTVNELLSTLSFLRADAFMDEPPADSEVGLDKPYFTVELQLKPSSGEEGGGRRLALTVGGSVLGGDFRALRGQESSLYKVSVQKLADLPRRIVDYRYKTLAAFSGSDVKSFEMTFQPQQSSAEEPPKVRGEQREGEWVTSPERMKAGAAARLVTELSDLRAADIAADAMGEKELAAIGLSPPAVVLRVYGAQPETGAAPLFAEIHLGNVDAGGIYARASDQERVYRLESGAAEYLPVSFEAFQELFVEKEGEAGPVLEPLVEPPAPARELFPADGVDAAPSNSNSAE